MITRPTAITSSSFIHSSSEGKFGIISKRALPEPVNYENQEESDPDSEDVTAIKVHIPPQPQPKKKDVLVLVKKNQARMEYTGYTNGDNLRLQLIG